LFIYKSESNLTEILFDEKKFQSFISIVPIKTVVIPSQIVQLGQSPPKTMATRHAPLVLPAQLHDLSQNYNQSIKSYDVEENILAQRHLDWFNDFVDLEEVDDEDFKVRLFAESL